MMGDGLVVLQFEEFGNPLWHYSVTGKAMEEVFNKLTQNGRTGNMRGLFLTQGSGGALGSSIYIHKKFPNAKTFAGEALECPTLMDNGFGEHRVEGIGDIHVPWIMNCKDLNGVACICDQDALDILRLFNEPAGRQILKNVVKLDPQFIQKLDLFGISSIANILGSIKMAKYYEMTEKDYIFTVATDSADMYRSRLQEMEENTGKFTERKAELVYHSSLIKQHPDNLLELGYRDKKRLHNLKYYTWIEQQGKPTQELIEQWYNEEYWTSRMESQKEFDESIREFNEKTGMAKKY